MAAIHGSSAVFNLDNSSGTPTDLTSYTRDVNFQLDEAMHDTTVFGQTSHTKTTGLKDSKFTAMFVSSNTIMDHLTGLFTTQSPGSTTTWTFIFGPRGSTSGYEKFTGECIMTALPIPAVVDNIETITAQFEVTGAVSITTY